MKIGAMLLKPPKSPRDILEVAKRIERAGLGPPLGFTSLVLIPSL